MSVYTFCKISAVTAKANRGSRLVTALICYVDDFGGSIGKRRDPARTAAIVELIRSFNWLLAPGKMVLSLPVRLRLLGFLLGTKDMLIRVPPDRREKLRAAAKDLVARDGRAPARLVCRVIGQVVSLQLALGLVS